MLIDDSADYLASEVSVSHTQTHIQKGESSTLELVQRSKHFFPLLWTEFADNTSNRVCFTSRLPSTKSVSSIIKMNV